MASKWGFLGAFAIITASASAQQAAIQPEIPQIIVSGHGELKVTPDRANIQISVQAREPTAAGAATDNAKRQAAVIASIKALGVADDQISTSNYSVSPEQRYEPNRDPIITGYVVHRWLAWRALASAQPSVLRRSLICRDTVHDEHPYERGGLGPEKKNKGCQNQ